MRERIQYVPSGEGERGERGKTGKSAYEVARDAGFKGTVADWIGSLRGRPGERGANGERGERGMAGADAAPAMLPTSAQFERDSGTKLTVRMLVNFPSGTVEVTPERDGEGFMYAATFAAV